MKKYLLLTAIIFISTVCFSQDIISTQTQETNSGANRPVSKFKSGYKGIIESGGYYWGVDGFGFGQMNFHLINGYQINPYFSLGLGFGADLYFGSGTEHFVLVPVFADFRADLIDAAISPYLSFDIGYSFDTSKDNLTGAGLMLNPTIGVKYKLSERHELYIGAGYQMQTFKDDYGSENFGAIVIKIGYSF